MGGCCHWWFPYLLGMTNGTAEEPPCVLEASAFRVRKGAEMLGKLVAKVKRLDFEELSRIQQYPIRNGLTALYYNKRMRRVRMIHMSLRSGFYRVVPFEHRPFTLERYKQSPGSIAGERRAIENFLGGRHPDPEIAARYKERSRQELLADPRVPEKEKERLRSQGPPEPTDGAAGDG